jgi:transcriptional regulator with XRE-family HTH domain
MTIRLHEKEVLHAIQITRYEAEVLYARLLEWLADLHGSAMAFTDDARKCRNREFLWNRLKELAAVLGYDLKSDFEPLAQKAEAEATASRMVSSVEDGWRPEDGWEKGHSVSRLLRDREWAKWSDAKIAEACGVTQQYVSALRKEIERILGPQAVTEERYATAEEIEKDDRQFIDYCRAQVQRAETKAYLEELWTAVADERQGIQNELRPDFIRKSGELPASDTGLAAKPEAQPTDMPGIAETRAFVEMVKNRLREEIGSAEGVSINYQRNLSDRA